MKNILIIPAIILPLCVRAEIPSKFNGLSGATLRAAISAEYQPAVTVEKIVDMRGGTDVGRYYDIFSGTVADVSELRASDIVPSEWFYSVYPSDCYNTLLMSEEAYDTRRDLPLGVVESVTYDNGIWRAGTTSVSGIPVGFYQPPAEFRGDMARVFFYYVTIYSPEALNPRGYMMLDATAYPALTPYARGVLMEYHKADPVSDDEIQRMKVIAAAQGNINPFVEYPELADYLWGEKAGETVVIPGQPVPLRGEYLLTDERIDLVSDYVPSDAEWTVDGHRVTEAYLVPSKLGVGNHQLRYSSRSGAAGMLTIKISEK